MNIRLNKIFEGQIFQVVFASVSTFVLYKLSNNTIPALWFFFGAAIPLIHQMWVSFFWRTQLYTNLFEPKPMKWFKLYKIGFIVFSLLRIISLYFTGKFDKGTLPIPLPLKLLIAIPIIIVSIYGMYSVIRYFTIDRAFGLDHFDPEVRKTGLVKKGIFRYTRNGMYGYTILFIYLFPLFLESKNSLYFAVYNHIILWIHYFSTEKLDMNEIYGKKDERKKKRI
jgi:protein-S-isoprenylcysteine O-methyltransferase Ste14